MTFGFQVEPWFRTARTKQLELVYCLEIEEHLYTADEAREVEGNGKGHARTRHRQGNRHT